MTDLNSNNRNYKNQIRDEINGINVIISSQFGDLMKNIQWYATLVVAEIAGVAKLTSISDGWAFAFFLIAIILLFSSICCLVYSNIRAQGIKFYIEKESTKLLSDLQFVDFTEVRENEIAEFRKSLKEVYEVMEDSDPQIITRFGLITFLIGTIIGGIGLLLS